MEKVKTSYLAAGFGKGLRPNTNRISESMVDAIIEISEDMKCEIDDTGDFKRARERF